MRRIATSIAVLGALSLAWAPTVAAQAPTQPQTPPAMKDAEKAAKVAQGKIKAVDEQAKQIELEDGTRLTVPASLNVQRTDLKIGAEVKAHYEEQGSEKVVTEFQLNPKSPGR